MTNDEVFIRSVFDWFVFDYRREPTRKELMSRIFFTTDYGRYDVHPAAKIRGAVRKWYPVIMEERRQLRLLVESVPDAPRLASSCVNGDVTWSGGVSGY